MLNTEVEEQTFKTKTQHKTSLSETHALSVRTASFWRQLVIRGLVAEYINCKQETAR